MKGLGFLKWDLYARANDPTFNRYCHKFCGYGFEVFVETAILLRKNDGHSLVVDEAVEDLAITTGLDVEKVKSALLSAINDYKLFKTTNDGKFYSNRVFRDVQESVERNKQNSENAKLGWEKRKKQGVEKCEINATALQTQSNSNASVMADKRKEIRDKREEIRDNNNVVSNTNVLSTTSGEAKKSLPADGENHGVSEPVFEELPVLGGGVYKVTESQIAKWQDAYPAVDVKQQVKAAHSWLDANKPNQKKDVKRFLNNWLSRNQDRARPVDTEVRNTIKGTDIPMTFRPSSLNGEGYDKNETFDSLFEKQKGAKKA